MNGISSQMMQANLASLKQAIQVSNLQATVHQDAKSMDMIKKMMEQSVTPHLGNKIDVSF